MRHFVSEYMSEIALPDPTYETVSENVGRRPRSYDVDIISA